MLHSGDVADACFYSMVEKEMISASDFERAGVLDWYRFRDDCLFLVQLGQGFKAALEKMKRLADLFELKVESVSTVEMRYLDLMVRREGDRIMALPYLKDPGLSRRLSRESAHPWAVHAAWPRMMLKRGEKLTDSNEALVAYNDELRSRFLADGCVVPPHGTVIRASPRLQKQIRFRLPLSYHPWWHRQIGRAVRRMNKDSSMTTLLSMANPKWAISKLSVGIAWKNFLPRTSSLIQH